MFSATSKSPFPRRTRINTQLDCEMAASEEQGGSSERSGSIGLTNYQGDGIIHVSSEILNSSTYAEEKNQAPKKPPKAVKKKQKISKEAINFLTKDLVMTPTNIQLSHYTNHSSVESLKQLESDNSRNFINISDNG